MASKTVSSLFVEFRASTKKYADDMAAISRETRKFEKTLKPIADTAATIGFGLLAVGGAALGALGSAARAAANYGDTIRDASIRTGIATDQLGILKYTAEQNGLSFEGLQSGLKKFAVNVNATSKATSEQSKIFKSLGVSVKDSNGAFLPMTALIGKVSDKFNAMPDGIQKTALAVQLFGRNGTEMIEFLSLGSKGMTEFEERARRLGLAIGPDAAKAGDDFNDAMADLKAAMLGLSIAVGGALLPTLTRFAVTLANAVASVSDFVRSHQELFRVLGAVAGVIGGTGGVLVGFAGMLLILPKVTAAMSAFSLAMTANPVGVLVVGIGALVAALIYFRNEIAGGVAKAIGYWLDMQALMVLAASKVAGAVGLTGLAGSLRSASEWISRSAANMKDIGSVLLSGESDIVKSTNAVKGLKDGHDSLQASIDKTAKKSKQWIQELPQALPWFARSGAAGGFAPNMQGGIGRGSSESMRFPQPEMPQVASVSPRASGGGGRGVNVAVTYAPVMRFDGMPADAERFWRSKLAPLLKDGVRYNVEGVRDAVETAMRKQGAAFQHG